MRGLLLKLMHDQRGQPEPRFWDLFNAVRYDLDRLFWCFANQPWMGAPSEFDAERCLEPFEGEGATGIQLWRPGSLSRYADRFGEEYINLWGIEPTQDDPSQAAARYCASAWSPEVVRQYARVWLLYTDSTCWEIFARKRTLLDRVRDALEGRPWVAIYDSDSEQRGWAFGRAGLSEVWQWLK